MKKQTVAMIIGAFLLAPSVVGPALAQERFHREAGDRDRRYYVHDMDRWRGGHWFHGPHAGRDGWWWVIDGGWYFYPAPEYPYPDPYALPMVVPAPGPPPVAAAPPTPPSAQAPAQAPYCREYNGNAIINGNNQPFYGTACLEQDGAWHIVN